VNYQKLSTNQCARFCAALCLFARKRASAPVTLRAARSMSTEKALKKAKAMKSKTAKAAKAPTTEAPDVSENHWSNWHVDDCYVSVGKNGKLQFKRRNKDKNGEYIPLNKRNALTIASMETEVFLISQGSELIGEGNAGCKRGDTYFTRGMAGFSLRLREGDLPEPVGGDALAAKQRECIKKVYAVCKRYMELVFEQDLPDWEPLFTKAWDSARLKLCGKYKCDETTDLERMEQKDPKVRKEVERVARELFVRAAPNMHGKPDKDSDDECADEIIARRNVWAHQKWKEEYARLKYDGLSCETVPPTAENFGIVLARMKADGRKYNEITYNDANGTPLKKPKNKVKVESTDDTGCVKTEFKSIENHWFDFVSRIGKMRMATLGATTVYFNPKRGGGNKSDDYGVKLSFGPAVAIVANQPNPEKRITNNASFATGFQMPEGAFEDENDGGDDVATDNAPPDGKDETEKDQAPEATALGKRAREDDGDDAQPSSKASKSDAEPISAMQAVQAQAGEGEGSASQASGDDEDAASAVEEDEDEEEDDDEEDEDDEE